jgi:hypothetical protein
MTTSARVTSIPGITARVLDPGTRIAVCRHAERKYVGAMLAKAVILYLLRVGGKIIQIAISIDV